MSGPATAARGLSGRGEQAPGAPASDAAFAILHALYWLAARLAERQPLLLAVDDAQWADEPSLRFLVYLLGRLGDQPVAVLVAARTGERDAGLLEQLASDPARVQVLRPLGAAAVARLVRGRLAEPDATRASEVIGGVSRPHSSRPVGEQVRLLGREVTARLALRE